MASSRWDSDVEINLSDFNDVDCDHESDDKKKIKNTLVQIKDLHSNMYVIVGLIFNENTEKELTKQFYAILSP